MGLEEQAQEREIDGFHYVVWPLPFSASKTILLKIIRALGAAAVAVNQSTSAQIAAIFSELKDADIKQIGESFGNASQYLDGAKPVPLIASTQELHFAGRFDAFLLWLLFSMEVNFSVFFDGQRRSAVKAAFEKVIAPKTPTG